MKDLKGQGSTLRNLAVADGVESLHPKGQPISHSTQFGFKELHPIFLPSSSPSISYNFLRFPAPPARPTGPPFPPREGVGQVVAAKLSAVQPCAYLFVLIL